jgi:tetratricopeptide (TPR) repeat protein
MGICERIRSWFRIVSGVLVVLFSLGSTVHGGQVEEYWQEGEKLYESHHLAPDRFDQALERYEEAVALRPNDYELRWELSKRYQIYGQTLGDDEKKRKLTAWKRGLHHGERALNVNPEGKEGHFYYMANMGAIAQIKGTLTSLWKFRRIKREMDRTLELDPDWPPILLPRAQYLMALPGIFGGDRQEAMELCQRVIELDPDHLPTYVCMARLLAEEGRYDEAVANLNRVLLCEAPRQVPNYLKVDRPRAEAVLEEIRKERGRAPDR